MLFFCFFVYYNCSVAIAQSLRDGGPHDLKLERFMEAVYNQDAQLSYHALVGTDVSQIFSSTVLDFFQSQGYTVEAEYVQNILNWRRA